MIRVKPTAKLPQSLFNSNGSYRKRLDYAKKLNAKFFDIVRNETTGDYLTPQQYKEFISRVLPSKIKLHVGKLKKEYLKNNIKGLTIFCGSEETINSILMNFQQIKYNENLGKVITDFTSIAHENYHLFASISNPKHTARCTFNSDEETDFYDKYMYNYPPKNFSYTYQLFWIKKLQDFLKTMPMDERISFLQNCRYRLLEENLAFIEQEKYSMAKSYRPYFHFDEKLDLIAVILEKTLKKARKQNKKSLS